MHKLESGVSYYTKAGLSKPICFPEDKVCRWYCPMFSKGVEECRLTNETVYKPKSFVGVQCPLRLEEDECSET